MMSMQKLNSQPSICSLCCNTENTKRISIPFNILKKKDSKISLSNNVRIKQNETLKKSSLVKQKKMPKT